MRLLDTILTLIAPHSCIACGTEGQLVCDWCKPHFLSIIPSRCFKCRKITESFNVCQACRKTVSLKNVWIATEYEGPAMQLIKKLKFERAYAAAECIGSLLDESLPHVENTIITHIPTASSRRRQRGYDQAELIAKAVARRRGLTHMTLLARTTQSRQVGSTKAQRIKQLENSFRVIGADRLNKRPVLLIDDIVTTGATLQQAAKTLKKSGVKHINAAVFAQKV